MAHRVIAALPWNQARVRAVTVDRHTHAVRPGRGYQFLFDPSVRFLFFGSAKAQLQVTRRSLVVHAAVVGPLAVLGAAWAFTRCRRTVASSPPAAAEEERQPTPS
jgi:hypothetical protein